MDHTRIDEIDDSAEDQNNAYEHWNKAVFVLLKLIHVSFIIDFGSKIPNNRGQWK
jgi:hypothetical protein